MIAPVRQFIRKHPDLSMILVLLVLFGLAQLLLGTQATPITTVEALSERLTDGQPTVLEFYSNL